MLNRFFVSPDFSIYFRRAKQLAWQNQATSGYSLLTTLKGELNYSVDENHESSKIPNPSYSNQTQASPQAANRSNFSS